MYSIGEVSAGVLLHAENILLRDYFFYPWLLASKIDSIYRLPHGERSSDSAV